MADTQKLIEQAGLRAEQMQLPYAGVLMPQEALEVLQNETTSVLVDVRTRAELELVGYVPFATHIEWAFYPGMTPNAQFAEFLQKQIDQDATVIFMCRTGGRSHNAAMLAKQLGYEKAYNMAEGFEGEANEMKQRTMINGWKHAGLPWVN